MSVWCLAGVRQLEIMCCFGCMSVLANYFVFMTFFPACVSLLLEVRAQLCCVCLTCWCLCGFLWLLLLFVRSAVPRESGRPSYLAAQRFVQSNGGGGQQAQSCNTEGQNDHGKRLTGYLVSLSLFEDVCNVCLHLQSLGLVMVHAHSRWIAEPLSIKSAVDMLGVGMELDHFSPRRIEPDKPLWQFYLTRWRSSLGCFNLTLAQLW